MATLTSCCRILMRRPADLLCCSKNDTHNVLPHIDPGPLWKNRLTGYLLGVLEKAREGK